MNDQTSTDSRIADSLLTLTARAVDHKLPVAWHQLSPWSGVLALLAFRTDLQQNSLFDAPEVDGLEEFPPPEDTPKQYRSADGSGNDLDNPDMGRAGTPIGRNMNPAALKGETEDDTLLTPNPREVSEKLLARKTFQPAKTLNLLAASWIQFQVHGWFDHDNLKETIKVPSPRRGQPEMLVERTEPIGVTDNGLPVYRNNQSQWWDASQLYGSTLKKQHELRSHRRGRLKMKGDLLPLETDVKRRKKDKSAPPKPGVDLTGFNRNWWVGLSMLHTLFAREHNSICNELKKEYRDWDDEQLFQTARLINCALMAKIHTIEWTPGILATPALQIAMNANWSGLLSDAVQKAMGDKLQSDAFGGIVGGTPDHFAADFAMTEEFVSVYRMHPLIPDEIDMVGDRRKPYPFKKVQGRATRDVVEKVGMARLFHSFGVAHPGAITLQNLPQALREFKMPNGNEVDLGAVDILRDRERGVPRYNKFRELLRLPPARDFEALTGARAVMGQAHLLYNSGKINDEQYKDLLKKAQLLQARAKQIEAVYGDIDKVDLMVGLFAELPPQGFGFSDTAFRIFVLMASRRLKSDRFYTSDYNAKTYTETGLRWIEENTMATVLLRHHKELEGVPMDRENAFRPWTTE